MNSKKYSSNLISVPLIAENCKRFWLGSVLAFLGYFLFGTLPIMMSYKPDHYLIHSMLTDGNYPPYIGMLLFVPVVAAFLIYRYMQQQSSTAIVHALPFSRKSLFHSNFLAGAILCILPILLNGIILMIISEPVTSPSYSPEGVEILVNIFTPGAICRWMLIYTVITLLLYAISMFAATVTGSSLLQIVFSIGFVFLVPGILVSMLGYCDTFMYGFTTPQLFENLLIWTCPIIGLVTGSLSAKLLLWYFVCFVLLYAASFCLHRIRKMEKATDTIAFQLFKPVFKYLATFLSMTLMAFMFYSFQNEMNYLFFVGAAVGAILGYVISDMIVQKSIKIKGFLKGFGIYLLFSVVFFGSFAMDLTGYEKRVPELSKIETAVISGIGESQYYWDTSLKTLNDPAVLSEIQELHRDLYGTNPGFFKENRYSGDYRSQYISIEYTLTNGNTLSRAYSVPYEFYANNEHARAIYESEIVKETLIPIFTMDTSVKSNITVTLNPSDNNTFFNTQSLIIKTEEMGDFLNMLKLDIMAETFAQETDMIAPMLMVEVKSPIKNKATVSSHSFHDERYTYDNYNVMPYYKNTVSWLKEKGYYDTISISVDDINHAEVYRYENNLPVEGTIAYSTATTVDIKAVDMIEKYGITGDKPIGIITDKDQLQEILNTGQDSVRSYSDYYLIILYSAESNTEGTSITRQYDMYRVPSFIKSL